MNKILLSIIVMIIVAVIDVLVFKIETGVTHKLTLLCVFYIFLYTIDKE